MRNKIRTGARSAIAALVLLPVLSADLLSWDQFLPYVYNSHTVITTDAALAANAALRATRASELSGWTKTLYSRILPRIPYDWSPMGSSELSGGFYPELHLDDGTYYTMNRLEEGNSVADKPRMFSKYHSTALFDAYCDFFTAKLGWANSAESCKELPNAGPGMPLHFLRGYIETGAKPRLWPAADSCRKGVEAVRALTWEAWSHWKKGRAETDKSAAMREYEKMYMFVGIGMHAVEDSFAPAHLQRFPENPRVIKDLCYYYDNAVLSPAEAGVCAHGVGDGNEPRDSISFKGNAQYPGNAGMRELATKAAQAYLTGFANTALNDVSGAGAGVDAFLEDFLVAGREEGKGYLDCSTLETY